MTYTVAPTTYTCSSAVVILNVGGRKTRRWSQILWWSVVSKLVRGNNIPIACWAHLTYLFSSGRWVGLKRNYLQPWVKLVGRDSSVDIATHYGLDGPRIESRWGARFAHPSRPALGPTQPPVQWVSGLFPGGKAGRAWLWAPSSI